jgi:hypothetical protein
VLTTLFALLPIPVAAGDRPVAAGPESVVQRALSLADAAGAREGHEGAQSPSRMMTGTDGQAQTNDSGSNSFFRTRAGVVALAVLTVGVAYALYSTSHDRVKSPAR